ncbi:hypothetical protein [Kineococcus radiotolerans]|uniref:MmyB family transcriptional regulator n=1 Tax=Kineococcus radiotolerans TaxID=131568 RepID=UPI00003A3D66
MAHRTDAEVAHRTDAEVAHRTGAEVTDMIEFRHPIIAGSSTATVRYPATPLTRRFTDPPIQDLVTELRADSTDFARLRQRHHAQAQPVITKTSRHPGVASITVDCDTPLLPDHDRP